MLANSDAQKWSNTVKIRKIVLTISPFQVFFHPCCSPPKPSLCPVLLLLSSESIPSGCSLLLSLRTNWFEPTFRSRDPHSLFPVLHLFGEAVMFFTSYREDKFGFFFLSSAATITLKMCSSYKLNITSKIKCHRFD